MKTTQLFTALALTLAAASGPVLAQEATYEYPQAAVSQVTRAAVLADLATARAEGTLQIHEGSNSRDSRDSRFMAQRSRDGVRAEAVSAARSGQIATLTAEPHDFDVAVPKAGATLALAAK